MATKIKEITQNVLAEFINHLDDNGGLKISKKEAFALFGMEQPIKVSRKPRQSSPTVSKGENKADSDDSDDDDDDYSECECDGCLQCDYCLRVAEEMAADGYSDALEAFKYEDLRLRMIDAFGWQSIDDWVYPPPPGLLDKAEEALADKAAAAKMKKTFGSNDGL